jgi:hypothetical protein
VTNSSKKIDKLKECENEQKLKAKNREILPLQQYQGYNRINGKSSSNTNLRQ